MLPENVIDATGLKCPLPVLKLRKALEPLGAGDRLVLVADDPVARLDVEHFCQTTGHSLLGVREKDGIVEFTVLKS